MKKSIILTVILVLLVTICLVAFTSCNSAHNYKERLEKKAYKVYYYDKYADGVQLIWSTVSAAGLEKDKVEWSMFAYDIAKGETIVMIVRMKDKKSAKQYYDYLKSHTTEAENVDCVEIKNRDVLFGSEQGVKDAEG